MKYTKIYVGSNNETKELEVGKISEVLYALQQDYSMFTGTGTFNNCAEPCAVIEIYGDYNTGIIPELKAKLKQDSILVVEQIAEVKFI